jgi:hypothetical protein
MAGGTSQRATPLTDSRCSSVVSSFAGAHSDDGALRSARSRASRRSTRACSSGRDPRRESDSPPAECHTKLRYLESAKTRRVVLVGNWIQSSGQSGVVAGQWLPGCAPRRGGSERGSSVGLPALAQLECGRDRRGPRRRWPATCVAQRNRMMLGGTGLPCAVPVGLWRVSRDISVLQ